LRLRGGMDNGAEDFDVDMEELPAVQTPSRITPPDASLQLRSALEINNWMSDADAVLEDPAYIQRYRETFNNLPADQQRAIRNWTHVDADSDGYSSDDSEISYQGLNYELNQALFTHKHYPGMEQEARNLSSGLSGLPSPNVQPMRLLRVADVDAGYLQKFKVGDLVTNSPAFMSASSDNLYAKATIHEQTAVAGGADQQGIAIYDIQSNSARPFINKITTLNSGEAEWLFKPNSVFRIEEIAEGTVPGEKPRYGIRLVEVPVHDNVIARNIYTGEQLMVYEHEPVYTTLP
jgi:hypothetical protein